MQVKMIVDLQFGSTGKGLIAGYLAERDQPDCVVNANMPNAGHTYINDEGRTWIHKVLPNGIVSPKLKYVMIGPQSVFSLEQLRKEYKDSFDLMSKVGLIIHESAAVLQDIHREVEQQSLSGISSTMQGSAAATVEKMMRNPDRDSRAKTVLKGTEFEECVTDHRAYQTIMQGCDKIQAEAAQGYSLGLNAGFWPYCTSRDCTPQRFLADMGIPLLNLDLHVVGTARVHPIRVGNTPDGYSGDWYSDQEEITWESIGQKAELTTVTKRARRIATWSWLQISDALNDCAPDEIFLNFCNYDTDQAVDIASKLPEIAYMGYGPARQDIHEVANHNGQITVLGQI